MCQECHTQPHTMSSRMNKFKSEFKLLANCQSHTACILFKQAPRILFIRAIVDATWTTLLGKLNLSSHDLAKVPMVHPVLHRIASRGQSLDKRQRILSMPNGIKTMKKLFMVLQTYKQQRLTRVMYFKVLKNQSKGKC